MSRNTSRVCASSRCSATRTPRREAFDGINAKLRGASRKAHLRQRPHAHPRQHRLHQLRHHRHSRLALHRGGHPCGRHNGAGQPHRLPAILPTVQRAHRADVPADEQHPHGAGGRRTHICAHRLRAREGRGLCHSRERARGRAGQHHRERYPHGRVGVETLSQSHRFHHLRQVDGGGGVRGRHLRLCARKDSAPRRQPRRKARAEDRARRLHGAGKTTITNLINRFYDVDEGKIRYDNINIQKIKKPDLRRSLGMVLQDTHLFTARCATTSATAT